MLGRLRRGDRLRIPVVAAITDLAALRFWSQMGADLHGVTHLGMGSNAAGENGPFA